MKTYWLLTIVFLTLLFTGCATKNVSIMPQTDVNSSGHYVAFDDLPEWNEARAASGLAVLRKQCALKPVPAMHDVCTFAMKAPDAKKFFETRFRVFMLADEQGETGLMTGYYEPQLNGSRTQSQHYPYPLYGTPADLLHVELAAALPELKHTYLRGRLRNREVVPYATRAQINAGEIDAPVLCYVDSDIDRFFLHVQGSGRVVFDDHSTIFIGHTDRNGWPYHSIGKLMVSEGLISKEKISLQSIRRYLKVHPEQKRRILESNPSYIFFGERNKGATGTLGVELTPMHSVAVDRARIPLGFPLYYAAQDPLTHKAIYNLALAQDTGSAIKGQVRADLFWGYGEDAEAKAGQMKSPLRLWLLVPR